MPETSGWEFWIDRGGTFTDVIGRAPDGRLHTAKLLSSDGAPELGIRRIVEAALGSNATLPPCAVKLGTTVATNALLERRGSRVLLVANRGLADVFRIGTQQRPDLFALRIERPEPLHAGAVEAAGRVAADGSELEAGDDAALRSALEDARAAGFDSVAAVAIHGYAHPEGEARWAALARACGFPHAVASHELAREIGLLARGETAIADAYLTPLLRRHVAALERALPAARLRFMQSTGGLTDGPRFRGPTALLSGPAGGVVGAAAVARAAGCRHAIGFDMGGTSTDVSLLVHGEVERAFETEVAGIRVRAPMLRVHSVAAGGGSLCRFDGIGLVVGPASAGAEPGPLCYGDPAARELTLTDANFFLGRLPPDRFPIALHAAPVERALDALRGELERAGHAMGRDELAAGFLEVANAAMARAIESVSVASGIDPRGCALVSFGGAGGQHACQVARALGIRRVLLHPLAGLLSAYGIGVAPPSWDGQRDAGRSPLADGGRVPAAIDAQLDALAEEGRAALAAEGVAPVRLRARRRLDLLYAGTDCALAVEAPADGDWAAAFTAAHLSRYGYTRPGRPIEIATARVQVTAAEGPPPVPSPPEHPDRVDHPPQAPEGRAQRAEGERSSSGRASAQQLRPTRAWFPGVGRVDAPVLRREALAVGVALDGPAIVLEETGTIAIDPGFRARLGADGVLELEDLEGAGGAPREPRADPVRLAVLGGRFMSIAEQMGAVLRNTAVSTNIKERLDYSCAVFDAAGGLVANAPHIPVHLGAMQETVRALGAAFPELAAGDVLATNDPFRGGSHLPDVTVVTPVFAGGSAPAFFVGSRGHHADLGGRSPGSMPPDSSSLAEEGVVIPPLRIVSGGRFDEAGVRARLAAGPWPARHPDDNVADLEAMIAANRAGAVRLEALVAELGLEPVAAAMRELQAAAAAKVRREIARLPEGDHRFADRLDDGTPIAVRVHVRGGAMAIDFAGTGAAPRGNLNAPRAVVLAAVLYVLRTLVAEGIPLNGGCLEPVALRLPTGSLLDPPPGAAVAGGNVETSQRIVDILLGALGLAAASQGTMNNVAFGDERFGYYETIGGGAGAGPGFDGASGVHVHMTNTRITDPEVLEVRLPVRLLEFAIRRGSGGAGRWRGGDGLVRRYEFLAPVTVSLLAERRTIGPFGLAGGGPGAPGRHTVERRGGALEALGGKASVRLVPGDRLHVETPGGGGYGERESIEPA
ncbi:MAG TPA: hydantoinase B/oxoprolinase family protein [Myxococcota bacterium]|nr:hydantoinase B/oxoprolinase family protein [Myxococcota bacterium]